VCLQLRVRKWFCRNPHCRRRIFTERLPTVAAPWARRTLRLTQRLGALGVALGGAAGVHLSQCWDLVVSRNTAVYLHPADNCVRPLQSRFPGMKQTVIAPQIRVSVPCSTRFVSSRTHRPHVVVQFSSSLTAYSVWDCGHGGTRNRSMSRSVHTWSVNPAAIAGVCGCHILAEPVPWVGTGCGKGWRKLACGKQKL
jgi:hypothetical protein